VELDDRIDLRVSTEEKLEIQSAAATEGLSISSYLLALHDAHVQWLERDQLRKRLRSETPPDRL
jgi:uncharacterized protein (DUF1778 family)